MRRLIAVLGAAALVTSLLAGSAAADPSEFGLESVGASLSTTEAGAHPDFTTTFKLKVDGKGAPFARTRDIFIDLPPGLVGNPTVVKQCTVAQLQTVGCPQDSQVGVTSVDVLDLAPNLLEPVFSMAPNNPNVVARFGFIAGLYPTYVDAEVRSSGSGADYGVTAKVEGAPAQGSLLRAATTIWGVPADESHDTQRLTSEEGGQGVTTVPPRKSGLPRKSFLINPSRCGVPLKVGFRVDSYSLPDQFAGADAPLGTITDCSALGFEPELEGRPTTNVAEAPSGLDFDLHLPQETIEDPDNVAEATLRDTIVNLPEGLVINPSGANGLDGCSPSQIGLTSSPGTSPPVFNGVPPQCPDASKLGAVEVNTPLLTHPLPGAVYAATPGQNPFGSLLAIYVVVKDPLSGLLIKLAGHVSPDPVTGRLTTTVEGAPPVPFGDFKLKFFGGAAAPLLTPALCGSYATTSVLTPWSAPDSGPPATPSDSYKIDQGAGGQPCATSSGSQPNSPFFEAGTQSPIAGAYSPFVVDLRREDGSQRFSTITLTPPPGLIGSLAGTAPCSEAALAAAAEKSGAGEKASPSCPAASRLGTVVAAAGAGPAPYYTTGIAYLAGPYKGAPISLAIITPATAGPYDIGTIVVRSALYVNPVTTQITAVSDPIPQILQGIPLDVRSAQVNLDRPRFTLNPTSCNRMAFSGRLLSTIGSIAPLTSPFQVGECGRLNFKPKITIQLKGGTKRGDYQRLSATVTAKPGEANIARASVTFPHSAFLAQEHIRTICTRVQFAAHTCPPGSIYGYATGTTPLLDGPVKGPVYLRSSPNPLPDVVAALRGPDSTPIEVELSGRVDSKNGGIRTTFDFVPDAPVSKFTVTMRGGKKSLFVNSRDLCGGTQRATVRLQAQNAKRLDLQPVVGNSCGGKGKARHRGRVAGG
jgi:hypothetical protein